MSGVYFPYGVYAKVSRLDDWDLVNDVSSSHILEESEQTRIVDRHWNVLKNDCFCVMIAPTTEPCSLHSRGK